MLRKDNEELKNSTQASSEYEKRIKDLENEYKQKSNSSDNILARIKELTCSNLNVGSYESWETSLTRAITTNTQEHINFQTVGERVRLLFMPHSPGIYIALVLKNHGEIE